MTTTAERPDPVRTHLAEALEWGSAHLTLEAVVEEWPDDLRGVRPEGMPHSAWELVEHMRRAQRDILDFCLPGSYREREWPDDYWPTDPEPATETAWSEAVDGYLEDRATLQTLVADPATDLLAVVPHGDEQTLLRAVLLVVDHNAHHLGQLILVRRALGLGSRGAE
jgi:uncharacterized damage-inducible protein DinB